MDTGVQDAIQLAIQHIVKVLNVNSSQDIASNVIMATGETTVKEHVSFSTVILTTVERITVIVVAVKTTIGEITVTKRVK